MGLCTRPWKSSAASTPSSRTAATRATVAFSAAGVSSHFISAVAFIFTALKPCAFRPRAASPTSSGLSPPIQA